MSRLGLAHVPEGRRPFADMTVRENLQLGAFQRSKAETLQSMERVFQSFPRLKERRKEVLEELSELEEVYLGKNQRDSSGDVSGYSTHPADQGSDEAMRDAAFGRGEATGKALEEIEEALQRLEGGEYGHCESCGVEIPDARLEALPHARFCIKCQEELERSGGARRR